MHESRNRSALFIGLVLNPYRRPHSQNPPSASPGDLPLSAFVGLVPQDDLFQLLTLEISVI